MVQQHVKEQADKGMLQFDKTLSSIVDKLADEGWTLPVELNIYVVNTIGNTNEITDVNKFLLQYYTKESYLQAKKMLEDILSAPIDESIKNLIKECWFAFENKKYLICANSLVAAVEGILSTFWEDKKNIWMMQVCQAKVDALANETLLFTADFIVRQTARDFLRLLICFLQLEIMQISRPQYKDFLNTDGIMQLSR